MTRQSRGWADSSARKGIRAAGKSFKAISIRFGGEKKQMLSASVERLQQQLQPLHLLLFVYFYCNNFNARSKPKPACTSRCFQLSPLRPTPGAAIKACPQHSQGIPQARQDRKMEEQREEGRGGDQWLKPSGSGRVPVPQRDGSL